MAEIETPYYLKELFPTAEPALLQLLNGAAENAFLLRSDLYTMRDWLEIANYGDQPELLALLALLFTALEEGSLCVEISTDALVRRVRDFVPIEAAETWASRLVQALASADFSALIGTSPFDRRPLILHEANGRRYLYFQKYLGAELDFQRALQQRLSQTADAVADHWPAILRDVLVEHPLRFGTRAMQLDVEQSFALGTALCQPFTIISGGPGTGKTSIVLTLLRCLVRAGFTPERIALAAPTGRAAQRLTDSLRAGAQRLDTPADAPLRDIAASTLHHLLGYRPRRNQFTRHRENPVPADIVIIDEVSMVGLVMMAQLLDALDPKTKLILLGDKDQLPSVDAGAVLAHLVGESPSTTFSGAHAQRLSMLFPDQKIPLSSDTSPLQNRVVLLRTNHRSQSAIREAAQAINSQDANLVDRLPGAKFPGGAALASLESQGGCWLLEQTHATSNELRGFVQHWADHTYFHSTLGGTTIAQLTKDIVLDNHDEANSAFAPLFTLLDRFRLLTLVRETAWGCDEINRTMEQYLRPRLEASERTGLFPGAPVLITRNDPARGLYNGDVGITLRARNGGLRVLFQRQNACVHFPAESLPAHELGFALTVHKSQGSEYANVMVVLPPTAGKRLLTKELVYTAITRAKSLAILCSTKDVLRFAIGRKIVRESGILCAKV
jgi:exodeoxyribonuclease V alpha subunit